MDLNGGRPRTSSGPSISLPSSSTFRRLPQIGRGPFKRDKTSTAVVETSIIGTEGSGHHRSSTPSSALSRDPVASSVEQSGPDLSGSPQSLTSVSHHLHPPLRSSSLHSSPQSHSDYGFPPQGTVPDETKMQARNVPMLSGTDLEPITYPAHLAQTRPPEPPPTGSRAQRDHTMGTGATILLGAVHSAQKETGASAGPSSASIATPAGADPGQDRVRSATRSSGKMPVSTDGSTVRERNPSSKTGKTGTKIVTPILPSAKSVARAPTSAMYFSPLPFHGRPPDQALRAHTGTLVGDSIWFVGGVDGKHCWRGVASFDTETYLWSSVETFGEQLPPLRAHTSTLVGTDLYIFGGGDGPTYSNEVWVLDTITRRYTHPALATPPAHRPPPRRAHTSVLYRHFLVVFGGGNGQAALNDVWALDISDPTHLTWHEWKSRGDLPQKKGYHTANLVGEKIVVFGGSDGHASFADVHVLDLQSLEWTLISTDVRHNRLSHTSTLVGSYLFIFGGHNGQTYAQDVLLFNLVTLQWESKHPRGIAPPGRGYHVAILHDARIFISGGYNGVSVFDDLWVLDLSAGAYLPQVTTFVIDETRSRTNTVAAEA